MNKQGDKRGAVSNPERKINKWKDIWPLFAPANVKIFLWRLLHNSLPTEVNLFSKKIVENSICPLCQQKPETGIHIIWNSCASNDIWAASPIPLHKWPRFLDDIHFM